MKTIPFAAPATEFGDSVMRKVYFGVGVFVLSIVLGINIDNNHVLRFCIVMIGLLTGIVCIFLVTRQLSSFRCPTCGKHIPERENKNRITSMPIQFLCSNCNMLWDTGVKTVFFVKRYEEDEEKVNI